MLQHYKVWEHSCIYTENHTIHSYQVRHTSNRLRETPSQRQIAQFEERWHINPEVIGSNPALVNLFLLKRQNCCQQVDILLNTKSDLEITHSTHSNCQGAILYALAVALCKVPIQTYIFPIFPYQRSSAKLKACNTHPRWIIIPHFIRQSVSSINCRNTEHCV